MTSTVYCVTKTTFCARLMQRLNFASCCKFKRKRGLGVTVEGLKIRRASALGGSTPPPGTSLKLMCLDSSNVPNSTKNTIFSLGRAHEILRTSLLKWFQRVLHAGSSYLGRCYAI